MNRILTLLCCAAASLTAVGAGAASPPNIVIIMADDFGYECVGANGGTSYRTPALDRMAATGLRFEHCYSQPLCTPSRVKLMTGIANVRNYASFGLLETSQVTFSQLLRDAGYATCITGKWQLGRDAGLPDHFGFDEHCLWQLFRRPSRYAAPGLEINGKPADFDGQYGPDIVNQYACDFIQRHRDQPFLLYYPMILTHCPFEPTPDSKDWDPGSKGSSTYKGDPKYFGDMVTYMDKMVGNVLAKLEEVGVADNTLVLFTGDNGTDQPVVSMMGDVEVAGGKGLTTDAGTHVPLIAHWPGTIPAGAVCRDLVDFSDFLPTICEAVGVPVRHAIDGRSFLPQLRGMPGNPRQWIYVWYARNGGPSGREFVRNHRYKLYRSGEFYDLHADVLEQQPLEQASEWTPEQQQVHQQLQTVLEQYADARPERFARWNQKKQQP